MYVKILKMKKLVAQIENLSNGNPFLSYNVLNSVDNIGYWVKRLSFTK